MLTDLWKYAFTSNTNIVPLEVPQAHVWYIICDIVMNTHKKFLSQYLAVSLQKKNAYHYLKVTLCPSKVKFLKDKVLFLCAVNPQYRVWCVHLNVNWIDGGANERRVVGHPNVWQR